MWAWSKRFADKFCEHLHADRGGISSELILEKILKLIVVIIMLKNRKKLSIFYQAAERHFQRLAGHINVSVDLKYDVCACECLCTAYPLESGEVTA